LSHSEKILLPEKPFSRTDTAKYSLSTLQQAIPVPSEKQSVQQPVPDKHFCKKKLDFLP